MAIIRHHHNHILSLPIATTTTIEAGQCVAVGTDGFAKVADANDVVLGLSADTNRASEANEYTNRVSDSGNETAASGQVSYYCGFGEFWVDVDDSTITTPGGTAITGAAADETFTYGDFLYCNASGQLTATAGTGDGDADHPVAVVIETRAELESGIPGTYLPENSTYASDTNRRDWIKIKLLV